MWLADPHQSVLLKVVAFICPFQASFGPVANWEWLCSLMVTSEPQSKKCFTLYIIWNKGKNWDLGLFPEHSLHQTSDIVRRNGRSTLKSPLHISPRLDSSHLFPRGTAVQRCFTTTIKSPRVWVQGCWWILAHLRYGLRLSSSNYTNTQKKIYRCFTRKIFTAEGQLPPWSIKSWEKVFVNAGDI